MGVGCDVAHRVDHVQGVDHVVRLREDGVLAVLHRVGRAGHLAVVHDRFGLELAEQSLGDVPVGEVALGEPDLLAGDVLPGGDAVGQAGGDRREGVGAGFLVRAATQVVVDDVDLVAALAENRIAVGHPRYPSPPRIRMRMGGPFAVFGWEDATSYRVVSRQVGQGFQDPIDLVRRVVVAEADPDGAARIQDVEPLEQFHRVVVPVPGEDAALGERLRRVPGMLVAQPNRERGGPLGEPVGAGDAVQPMPADRCQAVQEPGRERAFVLTDRVERRSDLVGARGIAGGARVAGRAPPGSRPPR